MNNTNQDAVITVQQVPQYIKLAKSTVYKHARKGTLPGRKVGGYLAFFS